MLTQMVPILGSRYGAINPSVAPYPNLYPSSYFTKRPCYGTDFGNPDPIYRQCCGGRGFTSFQDLESIPEVGKRFAKQGLMSVREYPRTIQILYDRWPFYDGDRFQRY